MEKKNYQEKEMAKADGEYQSDFKALLTSLQRETEENLYLTGRAFYYANTLKPIERCAEKELAEPKREPQGVIEYLLEEVAKLKKSNQELGIVVIHLQNTIGS